MGIKDDAIAKITEEAMEIDDPVAIAIEEYLTMKCTGPSVAAKLLDESKTIKGVYDKIWYEAKKRKKGNVAFIPPHEVYEMIDAYYGLNEAAPQKPAPAADRVNVLDLL